MNGQRESEKKGPSKGGTRKSAKLNPKRKSSEVLLTKKGNNYRKKFKIGQMHEQMSYRTKNADLVVIN